MAKVIAKENSILLSPILIDIYAYYIYIISDRYYRSFSRMHATVSTCVVTTIEYINII